MNLKNCLIGLMLMAVSAGAMAEWTWLSTDTSDNKYYVDLSTIRKSGSTVKMWVVSDYKKEKSLYGGKSYLSQMNRTEFDCNEEKSREVSFYFYSGNMQNGDTVLSADLTREWSSIPPGSIAATLLKVACNTK